MDLVVEHDFLEERAKEEECLGVLGEAVAEFKEVGGVEVHERLRELLCARVGRKAWLRERV